MTGPLAGIRVLEMSGMGPTPFAAMMLADMGADVVRVDRPIDNPRGISSRPDFLQRGRPAVRLNIKNHDGAASVRELAGHADVFLEGYRPGVMERLGLGPEELTAINPRLVYGRMTGWGQDGPLATEPGHDINYISIAGALQPIGRAGEPPVPPLALVGDFGGGGLLMAFGICAALVERTTSGKGQVVDAACLDGASLLMTVVHSLRSDGRWRDERGVNLFDSGAPFYDVYETRDGLFVSVGAIEEQFYDAFVEGADLDPAVMYPQYDRSAWPARRAHIAERIRMRTRGQWVEQMAGREACFTPVLAPGEVSAHPQVAERNGFVEVEGYLQPAPAPRFSRTPGMARGATERESPVTAVRDRWSTTVQGFDQSAATYTRREPTTKTEIKLMDLKVTRYEISSKGVATVWLSRPGRGNSWTSRMNAEYRWLMESLDTDEDVRVIIVTGEGSQFCVGADAQALDYYTASEEEYTDSVNKADLAQPGHGIHPEFDHDLVWHWGLRKPVIAAINGACAGIAVALVSFCDLRFAVDGAKFTTATPRLGLPAEYGLAWILPRLMGATAAADVLFTGRVLRSDQMLRYGFLNDVLAAEDFLAKVTEVADTMATETSPAAVTAAKRQMYAELMTSSVGQAVEDSKARIGQMMREPDFQEGVRAMAEKRVPRFGRAALEKAGSGS